MVLDSIINDLQEAQRLLADNDTLVNVKMMQSVNIVLKAIIMEGVFLLIGEPE